MIVVPSFAPSTPGEAARFLRSFRGKSRLVELRTDRLSREDFHQVLDLPATPRVIVSHRSAPEGGAFRGSDEAYLGAIRRAVLSPAEFIDVEFARGGRLVREAVRMAGNARTILSYHDGTRTPRDLSGLFARMAAFDPAIVKISVTARSVADTAAVYRLLAAARALRRRTVCISMGDFGTHTRILQGIMGGHLSFSAADPGAPTAGGQITHTDMQKLYRAGTLTRSTKIFGLVGNPVVQSRGKIYHNMIFQRKRRDAVYVDVLVDELDGFMRSISGLFAGLSVTMPYKQEMSGYLDRTDESARGSGSVNTVLRRRGGLVGCNTDYEAFLSLIGRLTTLRGKRMLILGTGAVAATVAAAGLLSGASVTFCGRSNRRSNQIAGRFGAAWIPPDEIADERADILVNATPVGMAGSTGAAGGGRIVARRFVGNFRIVCDFVFSAQGDTALVGDARDHGLGVITGGEIFRRQARLQSAHFLSVA